MLIATYVDETGRHIIIRTVCVADDDLERWVCGVGVVWHVDVFFSYRCVKIRKIRFDALIGFRRKFPAGLPEIRNVGRYVFTTTSSQKLLLRGPIATLDG